MNTPIVEPVIAIHAEHAADAWADRCGAVERPDYYLADLKQIDNRISENLDGLVVAASRIWDLLAQGLEGGEPAAVFTAAVVAVTEGNRDWMSQVLEVVVDKYTAKAMASAIAWVGAGNDHRLTSQLLASENPLHQHAGLAANAIQGIALPDDLFQRRDLTSHPRFLKSIGELGLTSLRRPCSSQLSSDNVEARFWAAWSCRLLGDSSAKRELMDIVTNEPDFAEKACPLIARGEAYAATADWLGKLAANAELQRLALVTTGAIADPVLAPWLIEFMANEELAPAAGEAFSMITGVDLEREDLTVDAGEVDESAGASDEASGKAEPADTDAPLPVPDPSLVKGWWAENGGRFKPGKRYLAGKTINRDNLWTVLAEGPQRQRAAAAIELALLEPGKPLFNVRAKVGDQVRRILSQSCE
ncbi:TIGR02270 family protein [Fuerstiella marisgermanici]|uniref:TIGR02270 family protein n=1 Tax=Fuerstiella marisgermanici TaxID=1891926 RepID=A0A1P8WJY2_9PLAN|nr:TIGR02270 family protein [Fuerstiella marisgermanici]APZ94364.1 hypothetical protein Fuma_03996 [Fuerstiella marisgermanici]